MTASDDMNDFLDSIPPVESFVSNKPVPVAFERERHSCFECAGTGKWRRTSRPCFACKGKGYFLTSAQTRQKSKANSAARKEKQRDAAKATFEEANPGLIEGLREIAPWHDFARSLLQGYEQFGSLTDNQLAAAQRTLIKVREKQAEREEKKAKNTGTVDVSAISTAFSTAVMNGIKRPHFQTERLRISLASPRGANPGAIYVKCDGEYAGKIINNIFKPVSSAPADMLTLLREVAVSPFEAAKAYGKRTGTCACCGRELTNPESIEAGIGPICESNWGF